MKTIFLLFFFVLFGFAVRSQVKYPSLLWEITSSKFEKKSYLFGTYHISKKGVFKLADSFFYALNNVDVVATEIDPNSWQNDDEYRNNQYASYNKYIGQYSSEMFKEISLKKTNTLQKLPSFISIRSNFINYFLYRNNPSQQDFEEEMYLDRFIASAGYKLGKTVKGLETYFESEILTIEGRKNYQDLEKKENIKLPEGLTRKEIDDQIYDGYLNMNLDPLDSFAIYEYDKTFAEKFVIARNYMQADSILAVINSGKSIFGAVGSAHLVGEEGIINILRKKGFTVRPVKLVFKTDDLLNKIKKQIYKQVCNWYDVNKNITVYAPGKLYAYFSSPVYAEYGHVDFANGSFYLVNTLQNNYSYFSKDEKNILNDIDSLIYANTAGKVISKKKGKLNGYDILDVVSMVKNKDLEKYRYIVTPFEIIKLHVGGKNEFVNQPQIDSFFNSIKINYKAENTSVYGFTTKKYPLVLFAEDNQQNFEYLQKFLNYDEAKGQLNSVYKIKLNNGSYMSNKLIAHIVAESYFSSEIFNFSNERYPIYPKIHFNKPDKIILNNGKELHFNFILKFPFVYCVSSLCAQGNCDRKFIDEFVLAKNTNNNFKEFVDTEIQFVFSLPYEIDINKKFKETLNRKSKIHKEKKVKNSSDALEYKPNFFDIQKGGATNMIEFEDEKEMRVCFGNIYYLDSNASFPNASTFWSYFKPLLSKTKTTENDLYYSKLKKGEIIINEQLDTGSVNFQTYSFWIKDTINQRNRFNTYYLANNKLLKLYAYGSDFQLEIDPTVQAIMKSVKPYYKEGKVLPITIFTKKPFKKIITEYLNSKIAYEQEDLLSLLNSTYFSASDTSYISGIFNKLSSKNPAHNILKRKLIDMMAIYVSKLNYNKGVVKWIKRIYAQPNEKLSIKSDILQTIINARNVNDIEFVYNETMREKSFFSDIFLDEAINYFSELKPKDVAKKMMKINFGNAENLKYSYLFDAGYFTKADKQLAFNNAKIKLLKNENEIKLKNEKVLFEFEKNDDEDDKEDRYSNSQTEQRSFLIFFKRYYDDFPKDKFFDSVFKNIYNSKNDEDLIDFINVLLTLKSDVGKYINPLIKYFELKKSYHPELNQAFYKADKYHLLPDLFKEKENFGKQLLKDSRSSYNSIDTILFIKKMPNPYQADEEIYFYYYIAENSTIKKIAFIPMKIKYPYVISTTSDGDITTTPKSNYFIKKLDELNDSENEFDNKNLIPSILKMELTNETLENKIELQDKQFQKLINQQFTKVYFADSYRDFYNNKDVEKSIVSCD